MAAQAGAKCYTCNKALTGNWNMTTCNGYDQTGRYLGVTNGYFLHGQNPNWVYSYCQECWKKHILALPFVQEQIKVYKDIIGSLPHDFVPGLRNKKDRLSKEIQGLQTRLQVLNVANDAISKAVAPLNQELKNIEAQIKQLTQ
eukprot:200218_1